MFPPLEEIKELRRQLGWTQKELARRSGVSQSTIAKVEKGRIVPSYDIAVKIFTILYEGGSEREKSVEEIMHAEVITAKATDYVRDIGEKMKEEGISQLPVIEEGRVVGLITEGNITDAFLEHGKDAGMLIVGEIMDPPPPVVGRKTRIRAVAELLKQYPAVLISDGNEIAGIVTRADIVYWMLGW